MKPVAFVPALALIALCLGSSLIAEQPIQSEAGDMIWLKNSSIKVGLKKSSGGAIAWVGSADGQRNLINSHDRGRLIQQSWYGQEDGSLWNKRPWRWNPVQGGDWRGKSASIIEQRHGPTSSFVRSRPVHWATGKDLEDCDMQQTISLNEETVHVHYRFQYQGSISHSQRHQELPAFFVDASLDTLVTYEGDSAWSDGPMTRRQPNFPNEYGRISEHWAAYVDGNDRGIGLFVPKADEATFYRYPAKMDRKNKVDDSWCSYVAPIRTLAVQSDFEYSYDVWITMGSSEEIRQRFKLIAEGLEKK
jgi:hypothetical protein